VNLRGRILGGLISLGGAGVLNKRSGNEYKDFQEESRPHVPQKKKEGGGEYLPAGGGGGRSHGGKMEIRRLKPGPGSRGAPSEQGGGGKKGGEMAKRKLTTNKNCQSRKESRNLAFAEDTIPNWGGYVKDNTSPGGKDGRSFSKAPPIRS